ncbi:MAG: hypothetical protein Q9166_002461 [cf. Caloplaca sp. 2 TL-2023]
MTASTRSQARTPQPDTTNDLLYIPRGSVTAELKFYAPPVDGSKPWNYVEEPTEGPKRNFGDIDIPVTITDIRDREFLYSLDENAFATFKTAPSAEKEFMSDQSIKEKYYPEVEQLLLENVHGAKRIFLFDHTLRRVGGNRPPVLRAHIDQNKKAAIGRVQHFLPQEADDLLKHRVRIINVWRPLNGPVQCSPLAFADSKTVDDEGLITVEHRYPDRIGETLSVKHMNEQWYYWSGMRNDERLLLECFDSEKGGRVPHTAFVDPRSPVGGRQRESIEVRALVFG